MPDNYNPQLGSPDGPVPEAEPAQQLEHLHQLSPDPALPPTEAYNSVTEPIPASPLDLTTVALETAQRVDWRDALGYAQHYTQAITQATPESNPSDDPQI